jgi:hypothetical protein
MYSIVLMSVMFYVMNGFARRISMHKSLNGKELMYISIEWLHDLNAIVFYNETSTYNFSCLVCLNVFY